MSDPQPDRLKKRPARAEPLQPDLPGQGDKQLDPSAGDQGSAKDGDPSAKKLREQSENALDNVRKGYD